MIKLKSYRFRYCAIKVYISLVFVCKANRLVFVAYFAADLADTAISACYCLFQPIWYRFFSISSFCHIGFHPVRGFYSTAFAPNTMPQQITLIPFGFLSLSLSSLHLSNLCRYAAGLAEMELGFWIIFFKLPCLKRNKPLAVKIPKDVPSAANAFYFSKFHFLCHLSFSSISLTTRQQKAHSSNLLKMQLKL